MSVVVGPFNPVLNLASEDSSIPYLVTTYPNDDAGLNENTFHLLPQSSVVHDMVRDLVQLFNWNDAAVLYDQHQGIS